MTTSRVLAVLMLATLSISLKTEHEIQFEQHLMRVSRFSCRTPRATAVPVSELLSVSPDKLYSPEFTVLSRCTSGSGCCLGHPAAYCAPKLQQTVFLPFKVKDAVNKGQPDLIIDIAVVNHTKCACMQLEGPR